MWSVDSRTRAIQAFQRAEILGLAKASPEQADAASLREHYTRIGEWLPRGLAGRVLEIGCGPGRYVALLASLGYDVVGVDPFSFPVWEEIKRHRAVDFREGVFAERLPFEDASFEHVACLGALLYFNDPVKALSEMRRVMKPGGRLFMRTVNRENLLRLMRAKNMDPAAKNYFTEMELAELLRDAGFMVKKTFAYGFYPPVIPNFWWYLVNGKISIRVQEWLSSTTPARYRVNVVALACLP